MANLGYLQITRQCNQKCRFCSNPPTEFTVTYEQARERIDDFRARGYLGVLLTGGEPTLSKDLPHLIDYCRSSDFMCKVISNGQNMADLDYLRSLVDVGLRHVCISVHSCRPDVEAFLTRNRSSLEKVLVALDHLGSVGVTTDVLTTITRANADHLHETIRFIDERFPFIFHYTWNGLDPRTDRIAENRDLVPRLSDFEWSLTRAMRYLEEHGKPFQVERVPLCYMAEYAHCSTETRRMVKGEERGIYFLDERGFYHWTDWTKEKGEACRICTMEPICAGLHEGGTYYSLDELYPLFLAPEAIRDRILSESTSHSRGEESSPNT